MKRARLAPDDALPPAPDTLPPPWPGRRVELAGSGIYVRDTPATGPDAEPALYVHGLGGSAQNWTDFAWLLSARLDGQAIDLPGFGQSDPAADGRYTPEAFAGTVIRWIEFTGRGPVHLFGNSLGGAVAVRVAGRRPDLIRTLTLVSPAMPVLRPRHSHRQMVPVLVVPGVERIVDRVLRASTPEQLAEGVLDMCFADPSKANPRRIAEAVAEAQRRLETPWAAGVYVRSLRGLAYSYLVPGNRSLWRVATRITAPTLVAWGKQDKLVDVRLAPRTARAIPDSRLMIVDGVGHTAQLESPRILARAVLSLLDEYSAAATSDRDAGPLAPAGHEEAF